MFCITVFLFPLLTAGVNTVQFIDSFINVVGFRFLEVFVDIIYLIIIEHFFEEVVYIEFRA